MNSPSVNLAISVRQRLLNGARERGEEFGFTLTRYAIERLLYRLSQSPQRDNFILKGAALYAVWSQESANFAFRPTRDVDFWSAGEASVEAMVKTFGAICATSVQPDGLTFDASQVRGEVMREDQRYAGCRLHVLAHLGTARIPLQIDIGFGDAVTPSAQADDYPTLLAFPAPRLRLYPRETVVAEKFEAMVSLGATNTRMKDFFDVWSLCGHFTFNGDLLCRALSATFTRRATPLPIEAPFALTTQFLQDSAKISAWQAFARRNALLVPELSLVGTRLSQFLLPPSRAAANQSVFNALWQPGEGWVD